MSLAQVQLEADRKRLSGTPALLRRKWQRMAASPFAFLRGASALWAEALRREPKLLQGLPGRGTLVGDLHLENVGTYRTARGVALNVNDFDETFEGPWAFDLARLVTSLLLARPELRATGPEVLSLAGQLLEGHALGVAGRSPRLPAALASVVKAASLKPDGKLLAKRLASPGRLLRDEKSPPAPAAWGPLAQAAVATWAAATGQAAPVSLVDLTRRVAGTGSLGVARLQALVKVGPEPRLLELKEVRGSTFAHGAPDAQALVHAVNTCLPRPPLELAAAALGRVPVVVRPLFASDDKLSAEDLDRAALPSIVRAIGVMAGHIHRRGAQATPRWTDAHRTRLLESSIHLAGLHEQAFLAFCRAAEVWADPLVPAPGQG